jgi:AraC-like DNA-binding protein
MNSLIRSSALSGFVTLVDEMGGDTDGMLRQVRLRRSDLQQDSGVISYTTVVSLLDTAAAELGCDDFGLRLSRRQGLEILGPVAVIARNSATLGEALASIGRFMSAYSPAITIDVVHPSRFEACLTFDLTDPRIPRRRQTIELSLGVAYNAVRVLTGQRFVPEAVLFRHARGLPKGKYRKYFGTAARFGQEHDGLLMKSAYLDQKMDRADAYLRDLVTDYIEQVTSLHGLDLQEQVAVLVERLLPTLRCDLGSVANHLGLHPRTLQRRLAAENVIFEDIVDQLRRNRAETYLSERALPISHVAGMLGYAEQSSFNRACRRWFGQTPGEHRRHLLAGCEAGQRLRRKS